MQLADTELARPPGGRAGSGPRRRLAATYALAAAALVVFLGACRIAPPPPPPPADTVVASGDPQASVDSFSLAPGEWKDYQLDLPAGVRAIYDVIYLELDDGGAGAVLELRSPTYWLVLASSAAPSRFIRGAFSGVPQPVPAPAVSANALDPSAVSANLACRGPCVIFAPSGGSYYARVVNDGGTTISFDLYLYGEDLQDDTEPQNDSRSNSPVLGAEVSGAIELLGDVDYWLAPDDLAVTFEAVPGVVSEAVVTSASGLVVAGPYQSGNTFSVFAGESLRVRAANDAGAGAPAASTYFLSSSPLPPGTPGRPPSGVEVTAGTSASQPLDTRTFASGETVEYLLSVPSTVRNSDVLYVELSQDVGLELRDGSGNATIASSSSSASFFGGTGPFGEAAAAADGLGSAAVDVNVTCRGSCVIVEPGSTIYRVYVTNFGGSRTISLYAYGSGFMDSTEPQNDLPGSAPVLSGTDGGAIETIGDTDYWYMANNGTVAFDTVSGGIALEAEIVDDNGNVVPDSGGPFGSGESFLVFAGEYVRVWALDPDEAAVAANSAYFLDYTVSNAGEQRR